MTIPVVHSQDWREYRLIDSGKGQKLEEFAGFKTVRPDPRAIWLPKNQNWQADAMFDRNSSEGRWLFNKQPPIHWLISYKALTFKLKPTDFRHVGIFPEQAVNWDWLSERLDASPQRILNLFAYTGGASLAAAKSGAKVTHVDSSKSIISWAKENAKLSNLPSDAIRWIEDDCAKFVEREKRRGQTYDGVVLDPPRFGHGTRGEIWKLQSDLPRLLQAVKEILVPKPKFVLLNLYTADLSPVAVSQLFQDVFQFKSEVFELAIKQENSDKLLPAGIICRSI